MERGRKSSDGYPSDCDSQCDFNDLLLFRFIIRRSFHWFKSVSFHLNNELEFYIENLKSGEKVKEGGFFIRLNSITTTFKSHLYLLSIKAPRGVHRNCSKKY